MWPAVPRRGSPYGPAYARARARLLSAYRVCQWCHELPATVADHDPPLGFHTHVEGSGCCVLVASCRRCNAGRGRGGWWVANQRRRMHRAGVPIPGTWRKPPPGVIPPAPHVERVPPVRLERRLAAEGKVIVCGEVFTDGEVDRDDEPPPPVPRRVPRIW